MIDALTRFYETDYANIHRGVYDLSQRATAAHDEARRKVQRFLNARRLARDRLRPQRHRGRSTSWRRAIAAAAAPARRRDPGHRDGAPRQHRALAARGGRDRRQGGGGAGHRRRRARHRRRSRERLTERTRMVAVVWVSNVLGTVNPVHEIVGHRPRARRAGPDRRGAGRAAPAGRRAGARRRLPRLLGPQALRAVGRRRALRARPSILEAMPPYQGGGDMIERVTLRAGRPSTRSRSASRPARPTSPASSPWVPPSTTSRASASSAIARARAASSWPTRTRALNQIPGLRMIGTAREKAAC